MIAANRKTPNPLSRSEIAGAVPIEQVLTWTLLKAHIVADGLQHTDELLVQVARMHGTRCACRSTKSPETSRYELGIRYIRRLMTISSTENTQCGVLTLLWIIYLNIGLNHVALPKNHRAYNSLFGSFLATGLNWRRWPPTPPVTGKWPMASPTFASPNERQYVGSFPGKDAGRQGQEQS
jgi:hypothetical protein